MLPPLPTPSASTWLPMPVTCVPVPTPSRETISVALIVTSPAFPCPDVLATKVASLDTDIVPVVISMLPPSPTAPASTWLPMPVEDPRRETASVARIVTSPAFPCPEVLATMVAPPDTDIVSVLISMLPPSPTAPPSTWLPMPVEDPSRETASVARIVTSPAFPCPEVLAAKVAPPDTDIVFVVILMLPPSPCAEVSITKVAPLDTDIVPVVISMLPPLPTAPASTWLPMPVEDPPRETASVALIVTSPAFPCPEVLAAKVAPPDTDIVPVVISMLPPLPTAPASTWLPIAVEDPSRETASVALIVTSPAFPCPEVLAAKVAPPDTDIV